MKRTIMGIVAGCLLFAAAPGAAQAQSGCVGEIETGGFGIPPQLPAKSVYAATSAVVPPGGRCHTRRVRSWDINQGVYTSAPTGWQLCHGFTAMQTPTSLKVDAYQCALTPAGTFIMDLSVTTNRQAYVQNGDSGRHTIPSYAIDLGSNNAPAARRAAIAADGGVASIFVNQIAARDAGQATGDVALATDAGQSCVLVWRSSTTGGGGCTPIGVVQAGGALFSYTENDVKSVYAIAPKAATTAVLTDGDVRRQVKVANGLASFENVSAGKVQVRWKAGKKLLGKGSL